MPEMFNFFIKLFVNVYVLLKQNDFYQFQYLNRKFHVKIMIKHRVTYSNRHNIKLKMIYAFTYVFGDNM